jgi:hypothetical protein
VGGSSQARPLPGSAPLCVNCETLCLSICWVQPATPTSTAGHLVLQGVETLTCVPLPYGSEQDCGVVLLLMCVVKISLLCLLVLMLSLPNLSSPHLEVRGL